MTCKIINKDKGEEQENGISSQTRKSSREVCYECLDRNLAVSHLRPGSPVAAIYPRA